MEAVEEGVKPKERADRGAARWGRCGFGGVSQAPDPAWGLAPSHRVLEPVEARWVVGVGGGEMPPSSPALSGGGILSAPPATPLASAGCPPAVPTAGAPGWVLDLVLDQSSVSIPWHSTAAAGDLPRRRGHYPLPGSVCAASPCSQPRDGGSCRASPRARWQQRSPGTLLFLPPALAHAQAAIKGSAP